MKLRPLAWSIGLGLFAFIYAGRTWRFEVNWDRAILLTLIGLGVGFAIGSALDRLAKKS